MKKILSPLMLAWGLAAAAGLTGCASAPVRHPKETQKVALSINRVAPDLPMAVITAVQFILPPGPAGSEGYVWEITSNNVKVLEQMGPMMPGPPGDGSAAPTTLASFYALKPGRSVVRFVLVRPGEAEATPAAKCEVTVRVLE
jgi:hypothetical protein